MTTYRINEHTYQLGASAFGAALVEAHARRIRPLCMCLGRGVEMYVAKIAGKFYIKRMPGTGAHHAPVCDSYEEPQELSGLGQVMGTAITENPDDGLTNLKLNFSLTKMGARAKPMPSSAESDSVKTDGNKLTLRGVLHYLWKEAGFHRWSPSMEGKRN